MLLSLRIQNFALVDALELEFKAGLNVLTGETGAGKSIVLDAIDAALGGKMTGRFVRTGSRRATVEAAFRLSPAVESWLEAQDIEPIEEGAVLCSRELSVGGSKGALRSRSRVNGILVNRQLMAQLRSHLVEITAQGQTVDLMLPTRQRELLDLYAGEALRQQKEAVARVFSTYQSIKKTLSDRRTSEQQRLQQLDLLQYQMQELDAAELGDPDEIEQLEQEGERLSHAVELKDLSYQVYQLLYQSETDGGAATDILGQAAVILDDMVRYDAQLEPILEIVQSAIAQVVEAGQQANSYGESLEADPERLSEVETRLRTLKQICRKYGPTLAEAIAYEQQIRAELEQLTDSSQSLEELEKQLRDREKNLLKTCKKLTQQRRESADRLEQQLVAELKPLAMEKVRFECRLAPCTPSAAGAEQVQFYFSPNPGEALKPLSETASGGEMSRFLLALKACFTQSETRAGTLVFDEIDAGVSGRVASAIGEKLHQLSEQHQILCVTHQPLIAALADAHFRVQKQVTDVVETESDKKTVQSRTVVRVTALDGQTRKEELAQLAGGHSAQEAIAFAESLLAQASNRRQENGK